MPSVNMRCTYLESFQKRVGKYAVGLPSPRVLAAGLLLAGSVTPTGADSLEVGAQEICFSENPGLVSLLEPGHLVGAIVALVERWAVATMVPEFGLFLGCFKFATLQRRESSKVSRVIVG